MKQIPVAVECGLEHSDYPRQKPVNERTMCELGITGTSTVQPIRSRSLPYRRHDRLHASVDTSQEVKFCTGSCSPNRFHRVAARATVSLACGIRSLGTARPNFRPIHAKDFRRSSSTSSLGIVSLPFPENFSRYRFASTDTSGPSPSRILDSLVFGGSTDPRPADSQRAPF